MAILQASFRESDRAVAVGAWSALGGVAGAIGPFIGGALVDGPGWRWVFLINVPVSVVVIVCTRTAIPESRDPHATGKLDGRGVALSIVGLACGTWALTEAGAAGLGRRRSGGRPGRRDPCHGRVRRAPPAARPTRWCRPSSSGTGPSPS